MRIITPEMKKSAFDYYIRYLTEKANMALGRIPLYRRRFKGLSLKPWGWLSRSRYPIGFKHSHKREKARRIAQRNKMSYKLIDGDYVFFLKK